jgi:hypothetical protein
MQEFTAAKSIRTNFHYSFALALHHQMLFGARCEDRVVVPHPGWIRIQVQENEEKKVILS